MIVKTSTPVILPYGSRPLVIDSPFILERIGRVLEPESGEAISDIRAAAGEALASPLGCPRLREEVREEHRVCIGLLDASRYAPQEEMIRAVLDEIRHVKPDQITFVVATGTHKPSDPLSLGLRPEIAKQYRFENHNSRDSSRMKSAGRTVSRFSSIYGEKITDADLMVLQHLCREEKDRRLFEKDSLFSPFPLKINRDALHADFIVLLGAIKPHYFAGFSGGGKTFVPGLCDRRFIMRNHLLKVHDGSDVGVLNGNPMREEIEETRHFVENLRIVNAVMGRGRTVTHLVAGEAVAAHRQGAEHARRNFETAYEKSDVVIVSDALPVSQSIKQFKKVVGAASKVVKPNGVIIAAGECGLGVGSSSKINDFVYRLYLRNKLPDNVDILLVSDLHKEEVTMSGLFTPAEDIQEAVGYAVRKLGAGVTISVLPYGSHVIPKGPP